MDPCTNVNNMEMNSMLMSDFIGAKPCERGHRSAATRGRRFNARDPCALDTGKSYVDVARRAEGEGRVANVATREVSEQRSRAGSLQINLRVRSADIGHNRARAVICDAPPHVRLCVAVHRIRRNDEKARLAVSVGWHVHLVHSEVCLEAAVLIKPLCVPAEERGGQAANRWRAAMVSIRHASTTTHVRNPKRMQGRHRCRKRERKEAEKGSDARNRPLLDPMVHCKDVCLGERVKL